MTASRARIDDHKVIRGKANGLEICVKKGDGSLTATIVEVGRWVGAQCVSCILSIRPINARQAVACGGLPPAGCASRSLVRFFEPKSGARHWKSRNPKTGGARSQRVSFTTERCQTSAHVRASQDTRFQVFVCPLHASYPPASYSRSSRETGPALSPFWSGRWQSGNTVSEFGGFSISRLATGGNPSGNHLRRSSLTLHGASKLCTSVLRRQPGIA